METTENAFLGGRLSILQPKSGYQAGADPVFLAAAVDARPGQRVLDLGCGVGTALLCLMAREPAILVTGVELQPDLAKLAEANMDRNGVGGDIVTANIEHLPPTLLDQSFDHVMTNPPFFDRQTGSAAKNVGRELGRGAGMDTVSWLEIALRRVATGGHLTLINRAERLPDCLLALRDRAGDIVVKPLAPRIGRPAKLFILSARKGAKRPFQLSPPLLLHQGRHHERDGDSYTPDVQAILRDGQALTLRN